MKRHQRFEDFRNYDKEAQELIKGLSKNDLYNLYEIVRKELQRSHMPDRGKELKAVQKAIEGVQGLDISRLRSVKYGHRSEMAQGAKATDGNTRPNRKKV